MIILMEALQNILHTLGIGRRYKGYALLCYMIPLALEDDSRLYHMTQELFEPAAAHFHCDVSAVERNLRTVILHAWRVNPDAIRSLVKYPLTQTPTVKEFIDILVSYLLRAAVSRSSRRPVSL